MVGILMKWKAIGIPSYPLIALPQNVQEDKTFCTAIDGELGQMSYFFRSIQEHRHVIIVSNQDQCTRQFALLQSLIILGKKNI
jgi:hypothetical protein